MAIMMMMCINKTEIEIQLKNILNNKCLSV